jgi:hypothetical protein
MRHGEIREALRERLQTMHADQPDTVIRDELCLLLGQTRVDVAAINGQLTGYEIKGAQDNLARFPEQVRIYGEVLDQATVVAEGRHAERVAGHVPDWWGVWSVTNVAGRVVLDVARPALPNPQPNASAIAQLLWRQEALAILRAQGLDKGRRGATRWQLWEILVRSLSLDDLRAEVRRHLKERPRSQFGSLQKPGAPT